ncbi:MAG TPA: trypsin-like peptidase domain-containing protein, partial [Solirubrobacterales bacterium]|nr:trypsin-like peptidase domain-containing protein [Solirubrobacterales bacterium]
SGFVLNQRGEIVTNAHVVTADFAAPAPLGGDDDGSGESDGSDEIAGGERAPADRVYVEFPDRNVLEAEIIGADPFYDVALLRLLEPDAVDLHPLAIGDETQLTVGEGVAAIGNPFGEDQSLSVGVVSATDRSVRSLTEFQIEGAIQTDASINPGNSGGPLLNSAAEVVGVNQQIETRSGRSEGVGFAVPISAVLRSVEQMRETGSAAYPYIGVSSQSLYPQLAERIGIDSEFGGLVAEVVPDSPADEAGLQGGEERVRFQAGAYQTGGDVIVAVDGDPVIRPDDLARLIADNRPGDQVSLEVIRDGERRTIELTLGERPVGTLE